MTSDAPDPGLWAPIVHGRTKYSDTWWRALPPQVRPDGPGSAIVAAALAGTVKAPRFVLARCPFGTLIGVGCNADQLSRDMNTDSGRPLRCFVGWFCEDRQVLVPQFDTVSKRWVKWAELEYEHWMRPVWEERRPGTAQTGALQPPWWDLDDPRPPELGPEYRAEFENPPPDSVRIYPADYSALAWRGVDQYGRNATLVTGWSTMRAVAPSGLTHACVQEFQGVPKTFRLAPPQQPAPPAGQASGTRTPGHGGPTSGTGDYGGTRQPDFAQGSQRDRDDAPRRGGLGSLVSRGRRAARDAIDSFNSGYSQEFPPPPPSGRGAWTFRPDRDDFAAAQDGYQFRYKIRERAFVCRDGDNGPRFRWTGSGWDPITPGSVSQPEQGHHSQPQQSPMAGNPIRVPPRNPPAPVRLPSGGSALDEFEDAPLPEQKLAEPTDKYSESGAARDDLMRRGSAQDQPDGSPDERSGY